MHAALAMLLSLAATGPALRTKAALPGGARLEVGYDFDRNAIDESVEVDGRLVGRTHSGDLELFGEGGRKLLLVRVPPARALCLSRGRAGVLVGFADGTVARLELATLQPVVLATLPAPVWLVGERPSGGVIAVSERSDPAERAKGRMHEVTSEVHVLGGPTVVVHQRPAHLLIDRQDRAWLGTNRGEWGGGVEVVSLGDGKARELVTPDHEGVDGFLERPDGAVWAYGGTDHLGLGRSFVARVDGPELVTLFQGAAPPWRPRPDGGPPLLPVGPGAAILALLPEGRALVAFTHQRAFRVNDDFATWQRLFEARPRPWPQLSYPVAHWSWLAGVHRLGPGTFLLATHREGFLSITDGKETALGVPHQLGLERIRSIVPVGREVFFYGTPQQPPWHAIPEGFAPVDPRPAEARAADAGWRETSVLPAPGGGLASFTKIAGPRGHGSLIMTRWRGDRAQTVTELPAENNVETLFFTPDGKLWKVSGRHLYRLAGAEWQSGHLELDGRQALGLFTARVLETTGPDHWVHDQIGKRLYRLVHTPAEAKMAVVNLSEAGKSLDVLAAEPFGKGLLLATPKGLRLLPGDREPRLGPAPLALPDDAAITRLGHDGRGRLWLGGRGLWVVADGKAPLPLDEHLPVRDGTVGALGRNPADPDEMVVAFEARGVLTVRLREPRR